jgi:hypothetical protein
VYDCDALISAYNGGKKDEGILEQGAEENIWTK